MRLSPPEPGPRWVETRGRLLRYVLTPGRGPLLLLVHELGGALESWAPVIAALGDRASLAFDLPGHGLSEKPRGPVTLDDLVQQAEELLDIVAPGQPVLCVGAAAGAAVAIGLAARLGARAAGLVGMAPATGVPEGRRAIATAVADRVERDGMRGFFESDIAPNAWPEAVILRGPNFARFRALQIGTDPAGWAAVARMLLQVDLVPVLRGLRCPVLLMAGRHDRMRPPATIVDLAVGLVHVRTEVLDTGHFMALQSSLEVAARIADFADDIQDRGPVR